ncbi:MAG: hypothetical protein IJT82_07485 [Schwartzia sp.]|nr:hypothetical protein [Schwartzia sp. (in: firmicutes)]
MKNVKVFLAMSFFVISIFSFCTAASANFISNGHKFLYMDTKEFYSTLNDGTRIAFIKDNGICRLITTEDGVEHLSFTAYDGDAIGIGFRVEEFSFMDVPLYAVIADRGAHGENCGLWLVDQDNAGFSSIVTLGTLAKYGYEIGKWHRIAVYVKDGRLLIETSYEYMPEGASFGYEMKMKVDGLYEVYCDMSDYKFKVRRIK